MPKYSITTSEGDFQPGSHNKVLKNKLGITSESDMADAENTLLLKLYEYIFEPEFNIESMVFEDMKVWHRKWLAPIYDWAGELRTVDLSKGGFRFAAAQFLTNQIPSFEQMSLASFNHLNSLNLESLIRLLAESHVEFVLIHPFREGNGRLSRLLMDVMVTKAGFGPLDYSLWDENKTFYFKAIQAGVAGDYQHMKRLVRDILKK